MEADLSNLAPMRTLFPLRVGGCYIGASAVGARAIGGRLGLMGASRGCMGA